MKKLKNVHPGEILKEFFMDELKISFYDLAKAIDGDLREISQLINGSRSVTADAALRLSKYFGNSSQFWLNMQNHFDLEEEKGKKSKEYKKIKSHPWAKNKRLA
jgi:antitoxin HigA-1